MRKVGYLMHIGQTEEAIKRAENLYNADYNFDASCYLGCLFINGNRKYKIAKNLDISYYKKVIAPSTDEIQQHNEYLKKNLKKNYFN